MYLNLIKHTLLVAVLMHTNSIAQAAPDLIKHNEIKEYKCIKDRPSDRYTGKYYLRANLGLSEDLSSETRNIGVAGGIKIDCYKITEKLHFSFKIELYLKNKLTKVNNLEEEVNTTGLKLGELKYRHFEEWTPYINFGIENIESITNISTTDINAYVYGIGALYKINKSVSLKLEHSESYEHVFEDKVKSSTDLSIEWNFET